MINELKNIFTNKMKIVTLLAVLVLPLIYGGLYLWAFWDPYSQINKIPVAVVNQDIGWEDENLGNELVDSLNEKKDMDWNFVDKNESEQGLEKGKYYTVVLIPKDFSQKIITADKNNASSVYLEYKNREATNFMASKFGTSAVNKIQTTLNKEISKRYFDEVFKESRKSANDLKKAVDGAVKIKNGGHDIATASATLSDGLYSAYSGAGVLYEGLDDAVDGSNNLTSGLEKIQSANTSLSNLISIMQSYLFDGHDASMSAYLVKLSTGFSGVTTGVDSLKSGSNSLNDGLRKLRDGSKELQSGIDEAKSGSDKIKSGGEKIENGAKELSDELSDSREKALTKLENKNTEVLSSPVELENKSVSLVTNNGTAFAPYFISLSLWVGGMAVFFLLDLGSNARSKFFITQIISILQALILGWVLTKFVGLRYLYYLNFYIALIIMSLCFGMIQFFLTLVLKDAGKFISITILMLQLTSSAGSYPIETTPEFFQKIGKYMPMTYTVKSLREIISGGNIDIARENIMVIVITFAICAIINLVVTIDFKKFKVKKKKNGKRKQKRKNIAISN